MASVCEEGGRAKEADFWPVTTGCKLISLIFLPPFFLVLTASNAGGEPA